MCAKSSLQTMPQMCPQNGSYVRLIDCYNINYLLIISYVQITARGLTRVVDIEITVISLYSYCHQFWDPFIR